MPTISVNRERLFREIGQSYTEKAFYDLAFQFGVELDDVSVSDGETTYKIEVPANRTDLLTVEGIGLSLGQFVGTRAPPQYKRDENPFCSVHVSDRVEKIRPFIVCGVLEGVEVTEDVFSSLIDMQEKIHDGIGRNRSLVSIGVHDVSSVEGPFYYDALPFDKVEFVPLECTEKIKACQMGEVFSGKKISKYLPLLDGADLCPVVLDRNGEVLSVPPIINGERTKVVVAPQTRKTLFVEITATDLTRAEIALDVFIGTFSKYCSTPFACKGVTVHRRGAQTVTPSFVWREKRVAVDYLSRRIGVSLSGEGAVSCLSKMGLVGAVEGGDIAVLIPPTRRDIIHPCDILEDVAIGYGLGNIEKKTAPIHGPGEALFEERVKRKVREEMAFCGFVEAITHVLCSKSENALCDEDGAAGVVSVLNPKTVDFQQVRTTLLPGLLKTISKNLKGQKPIKVFEVSDVVHRDEDSDSGASNELRVCVAYCGNTSSFETVHGVVDRLFEFLRPLTDGAAHVVRPQSTRRYLCGRQAAIEFNGEKVGSVGTIHPSLLEEFRISYPVSVAEVSLTKVLSGRQR
ncbi:MAG: phenylalanyl-tRNA synthetase subunit beta [Amphiamblys sp. WSBS2006]|nr:MAG: phenylalanyl-tRNA synthetase subunit beta [Amphiamblys sp. WSBS2006]